MLFQQFLREFTYPHTFVSEKVIGIYVTANVIYLGRELCLGDSIGCCPLLAK